VFSQPEFLHLLPEARKARSRGSDRDGRQDDPSALDGYIEIIGAGEGADNALWQGELVFGSFLGKHNSLPPYLKDTILARIPQETFSRREAAENPGKMIIGGRQRSKIQVFAAGTI